jgi:hypothetical protein
MKLLVTLEIEVADLPDIERDELADGINFRGDNDTTLSPDLDTVPRLSDMGANELTGLPYEFFDGLAGYEAQQEIWAGTNTFVYFSKLTVTDVKAVTE